jgi:hypothetical protein
MRDRSARGGGVFICVKKCITCNKLWVDEDFEMIAVEVKGRDTKYSWEIIGIYKAPNQDMLAIERLAARTLLTRNSMKRSIICGDLNSPQADWNGDAEKTSGFQALVNKIVWDNGYIQVVTQPTRGDALLDIYLLRPDNSFISCNILPGISDHCGVLLEVEWVGNCSEPKADKTVRVYHKTDVVGLQTFLREKFKLWAGNDSSVEGIWKSYKDIVFEGIERFVPQKVLSRNPDPEYYTKEVRRLKVKVRTVYNKRKAGQHYQAVLKRLSKKLLIAKNKAQETFLSLVL